MHSKWLTKAWRLAALALVVLISEYALNMRAALIAVAALAIRAQTPPDPTDVLAHARDNMVERAKRLPNYTCVQTVDREHFVRSTPTPPYASCDQMSAAAHKKPYSLKVDATDRLRLDVKVSSGEEIGSWAGANRFDPRSIVEMAGGPFGSGQFGPLVLDVFVNIGTAFQYVGPDSQNNSAAFHYTFQVPVVASHLMIRDAGGGSWIATSYDGDLWIDPASFDLRRFSVRTSQLSQETGACQARMVADYARVRFDSGDFLVPRQSTLHFIMRDTEETEVASRYKLPGISRTIDSQLHRSRGWQRGPFEHSTCSEAASCRSKARSGFHFSYRH